MVDVKMLSFFLCGLLPCGTVWDGLDLQGPRVRLLAPASCGTIDACPQGIHLKNNTSAA